MQNNSAVATTSGGDTYSPPPGASKWIDPNAELKKKIAAMMMANPKQYTSLNAIYEKLKVEEMSEAEKTAADKKKDAERIVSQLEDFYFQNKIAKGNIGGIWPELTAQILNPSSAVARYKALLESNSPYLAKAAGDVGNLNIQEQVQARKPFPNARFDEKTAVEAFKEIRKKMGLSERDYEGIAKTKSLEALMLQFGGGQ